MSVAKCAIHFVKLVLNVRLRQMYTRDYIEITFFEGGFI
jgi:hypothetical protein